MTIYGLRRFPSLEPRNIAALLAAGALALTPLVGSAAAEESAAEESAADESAAAESAAQGDTAGYADIAKAETASDMVRQTSDEVLRLIEAAKGYAEEDPERLYRNVEALLSEVVDFHGFARSVMGPHSRDASAEQLERFAETFKWSLVRTYALALIEFDDGEVVVVPPDRPPRNPQRQTVKMEIRAGGEVYPVLYSVTQEDDGTWVIRNLIVNGVNMGLTYRNQFNSAMNDSRYGGDLDKVVDAWGEMIEDEGEEILDADGGAETET